MDALSLPLGDFCRWRQKWKGYGALISHAGLRSRRGSHHCLSLPPAEDKVSKERAEKILVSLKCCGDTCHTATTDTLAESQTILKVVQKGKGDLSDKFPLAARTLADKNPKGRLSIDITPPDAFTLSDLRKSLGQPDRVVKVERPGSIDVARQWYDWCAFGVTEDGQIVALAADLEKVKTMRRLP